MLWITWKGALHRRGWCEIDARRCARWQCANYGLGTHQRAPPGADARRTVPLRCGQGKSSHARKWAAKLSKYDCMLCKVRCVRTRSQMIPKRRHSFRSHTKTDKRESRFRASRDVGTGAVVRASLCWAMGRTVCSRPQAPQAHRSEVRSPPARQQTFTTTLTFDVTTRN